MPALRAAHASAALRLKPGAHLHRLGRLLRLRLGVSSQITARVGLAPLPHFVSFFDSVSAHCLSCFPSRLLPRPAPSLRGWVAQRLKPVGFAGSKAQACRLFAQRLKHSHHGPSPQSWSRWPRGPAGLICCRCSPRPGRNIADLTARADRWVAAGGVLEAMLAAPPPVEEESAVALMEAGPSRPDLPVRRDASRASLAAAVEAVRPANVKRAVAELRDNMLARSTRGPYESRLRTWNRLAFEGKVPAWPITTRTLEVIGAAFRAGAYRSAKEYFLAAFRYQEHDLRIEVDPLLRRFANSVIKAIVRGLPGARLKDPGSGLGAVGGLRGQGRLRPATGGALRRRLHRGGLVHVARDRGGSRQGRGPGRLARHRRPQPAAPQDRHGGREDAYPPVLRCACGATRHPLCPVHAAMRRMTRLGAAGLLASSGPLFPGGGGATRSKDESLTFLRAS